MNYLANLIDNSAFLALILFILGITLGVSAAISIIRLYDQFHPPTAPDKFVWWRYVALLSTPILLVLITTWRVDTLAIVVFISFGIIGTIWEWLVGYSYHQIFHHKLWEYPNENRGVYTRKLLSAPLWGVVGVIGWLLASAFVQ